MTPHVSILLPTRGPVADLDRLLLSVYRMATRPESIEVIARCDDDDPEIGNRAGCLTSHGATRITGPRWRGYMSMQAFAHQCARLATGDWLMHLDDDAEFARPGWDAALPVLPPRTVAAAHFGPSVPFWAVSRGWMEALGGYVYGGAPVDQWLVDVTAECGDVAKVIDLMPAKYIAHHYKSREAARRAGDDPVPASYQKAPDAITGPSLSVAEVRARFAAVPRV